MSYEKLANRWLHRNQIPVLTAQSGSATLERPVENIVAESYEVPNMTTLKVRYRQVHMRMTDDPGDFRVVCLPAETYTYTIPTSWFNRHPLPKRST